MLRIFQSHMALRQSTAILIFPALAWTSSVTVSLVSYTVRMTGTTSEPVVSSELYISEGNSHTAKQKTISDFSDAEFDLADTFTNVRTINICLTVAFANGCSRTLCQDITVGHQIYRKTMTRCDYPYTYSYVPQCSPTGNFLFTSSWGATSTSYPGPYTLMPGTAHFKWLDAAGCVVCEEEITLGTRQ